MPVILFLVFFMILPAGPVWAAEIPVLFKGIRPLGMGNAFTAVADDENSMFYNPAGLNRVEGFGGAGLVNPYFEFNKDFLSFFGDLNDVSDASTDSEQALLAADLLEKWLGKNLHFRSGLFPHVVFHNLGGGVLGQAFFNGQVNSPLGSRTLDVKFGYDVAAVLSGARGFSDKRVQVGLTAKFITRRFQDRSYTLLDLVQEDGIDLSDREIENGFGLDAGVNFNFPVPLGPSIALTVMNIGDLDLGDGGKLEQRVNLGLAVRPPVPLGKLVAALDYVDIGLSVGEDNDRAKRIHAGLEYRFPLVLSLRAGIHQGYPSFGAGLDLLFVRLDYAFYIEEIGAFAGQRADRRNIFQLTLGL